MNNKCFSCQYYGEEADHCFATQGDTCPEVDEELDELVSNCTDCPFNKGRRDAT